MGITDNKSDSYPGAELVGAEPITKSDCCQGQSVPALASRLAAAGVPFIVKGGRVFIDGTEEQVAAACNIGEPEIDTVFPEIFGDGYTVTASGDHYGSVQGVATLTNASTWGASTIFVQQTVQTWGNDEVVLIAVADALPAQPEYVYLYIENDCGERNTTGKACQIQLPV